MQIKSFLQAAPMLLPLTVASVAIGFTNPAEAATLGAASDYNVFVLGNMTQSNTDAEGKVAVGGNATLTNFYAGMSLPSGSPQDALVVGGNLSYQNGSVTGNAVYGGTANVSNVNFNNGGGLSQQNTSNFFSQTGSFLKSLSASLAGLAANGSTTFQYGSLTLLGSDSKLNVFNVSGSQLSSAYGITINAPQGSTVVVNVDGSSVALQNMGFSINGTSRQKVLYNFSGATSLTASGVGVDGSILAPHANFAFNNGQVNGNVIVGSLTGGGQSNRFLFEGDLPDEPRSTPEPATLVGLGLVAGVAGLSRRKQKQPV